MENQENYKKEKVTIDVVWANIFGIILLIPIVLIYGLPYYLIWVEKNPFSDFTLNAFAINGSILFLTMIIGIVAHELIHGLAWSIFARNGFKSIKFGVLWKIITPYCHCKEPLRVDHYITGAIMPAIILGLIPAIAAIFVGNFILLLFGMFLTLAACSDFLIIHALRKEKKDAYVEDHPSEAGCYVYRQVDKTENGNYAENQT